MLDKQQIVYNSAVVYNTQNIYSSAVYCSIINLRWFTVVPCNAGLPTTQEVYTSAV